MHPIIHQPVRRLASLLLLLLLLPVLTACGGGRALDVYLRANASRLERPASVDTRPVPFTVQPGTPAREIGRQLEEQGLIRDALLFEAYVTVNGLAGRLEAGDFLLAPSMTVPEIATALQNSQAAVVRVTVPEGWRLEQIADMLAAENVFADAVDGISAEAARYRQKAATGDLTGLPVDRYPFLQARPVGQGLEGYLFPATYELAVGDLTADAFLTRQLDAFALQVLPLYEEAVAAGATARPLHEILTLAAIVEREAVVPEERPAIAGVYLNRLDAGMQLDADPTVQYAMGYQPDREQWWKTPVFLEEYSAVISPYNTYLNAGLPPGPIAGPGLGSVAAVLYPEQHNYLYFVALPDGSGAHVFARTFEEHQINVQQYLQGP